MDFRFSIKKKLAKQRVIPLELFWTKNYSRIPYIDFSNEKLVLELLHVPYFGIHITESQNLSVKWFKLQIQNMATFQTQH